MKTLTIYKFNILLFVLSLACAALAYRFAFGELGAIAILTFALSLSVKANN